MYVGFRLLIIYRLKLGHIKNLYQARNLSVFNIYLAVDPRL